MSKAKTEVTEVAVQDKKTIMPRLSVRPALLVDDSIEAANIDGLPAEFAGGGFSTGFPPSVKFEKPGDFIAGEYVHLRENVGPNNSRVYEIAVAGNDGDSINTIVWGSTALDRLFDSQYPPVQQGDKLAIVYLGEKTTKRAKNPVKLFALKVKRG